MQRKIVCSFSVAVHTVAVLGIAVAGCGGGAVTHRNRDTITGYSSIQGAPKNTQYWAQVYTSHHMLNLKVFERSECDKIKVRLVSRARETLRGDQVIASEAPTLVQVAEGTEGVAPCEERYARGVEVFLAAGGATSPLGVASAQGELQVNVADILKRSLYHDESSAAQEADIVMQPIGVSEARRVASVSLKQLASYESRVEELLAEFRPLLDKQQDELSGRDLARSYEIFEQLREINAGDARIDALEARFVELAFGRRQREAAATLERNLQALAKAKDLLVAVAKAGEYSFPSAVRLMVEREEPDPRALLWALGQLAVSFRNQPELCRSPAGGSSWAWWEQKGGVSTTGLALELLRFAYGDGYQNDVLGLCNRAVR